MADRMLASYIVIFLAIVSLAVARCPSPYVEGFDGRCFRLSTETSNFADAHHACTLDNGELVSIHSSEENDKFLSFAAGAEFYIGLQYDQNTMDYTWTDSKAFDYTPRVVPHDCDKSFAFIFDHHGDWQSEQASSVGRFMCERPAQSDECGDYDIIAGRCLKYYASTKIPNDAESQCVDEGAHLVAIHHSEENDQILRYAKDSGARDGVVIGLKTFGSLRVWNDGSAPGTYFNFQPGSPNDSNGNCVQMNIGGENEGMWSNLQCTRAATGFICAKAEAT